MSTCYPSNNAADSARTRTGRTQPSPPRWCMCSESEAIDRQNHMELSEFESTVETHHLPPSQRVADPTLCVKKYRRSAAGGGVSLPASTSAYTNECGDDVQRKEEGLRQHRSVEHLDLTVNHLLHTVFCHRRSHHGNTTMTMKQKSLATTVAFVDDRLRAVQVDYVSRYSLACTTGTSVLLGSPLERRRKREEAGIARRTFLRLEAALIRYNVLVGYLLSEVSPSQFEKKFNAQALLTCIGTCRDLLLPTVFSPPQSSEEKDRKVEEEETRAIQDEVLCYASLLHTCAVVLAREVHADTAAASRHRGMLLLDGGGGLNALLTEAGLLSGMTNAASASKAGGAAVLRSGDSDDGSDQAQGRKSSLVRRLPKWKWSLEVSSALDDGNYVRFFHLLRHGNASLDSGSGSGSGSGGQNSWNKSGTVATAGTTPVMGKKSSPDSAGASVADGTTGLEGRMSSLQIAKKKSSLQVAREKALIGREKKEEQKNKNGGKSIGRGGRASSSSLQAATAMSNSNKSRNNNRPPPQCANPVDDTIRERRQRRRLEQQPGWLILSRCCLHPALPIVRLNMLRQYNKSYAKGEKVSGTDLARLLCLPSAGDAVAFCKSVGLPTGGSSVANTAAGQCVGGEESVIFKSAPISVEGTSLDCGTKRDDPFVFGGCADGSFGTGGGAWDDVASWSTMQRDSDGVVVPTSETLSVLLYGER